MDRSAPAKSKPDRLSMGSARASRIDGFIQKAEQKLEEKARQVEARLAQLEQLLGTIEGPEGDYLAQRGPVERDPHNLMAAIGDRSFRKKPAAKNTAEEADPTGQLYSVSLGQNFGRGVGYHTGYTSLDGFFIDRKPLHKLSPLVDVRVHHMNDNTWAANLGVGFRYKVNRFCTVFGLNAYFDYRQFHSYNFYQAGIGTEVYTPHWSARLNAYIPVGERDVYLGHRSQQLSDGSIFITEKNVSSLGGADLRVGVPFIQQSWLWSWIEVGPYFYQDFFGGLGEITARVADYVRLKFGVTYDPVFRARAQGEVAVVFSFGKRKKCTYKRCPTQCCTDFEQPIQREEIIPLYRCFRRERHFN